MTPTHEIRRPPSRTPSMMRSPPHESFMLILCNATAPLPAVEIAYSIDRSESHALRQVLRVVLAVERMAICATFPLQRMEYVQSLQST